MTTFARGRAHVVAAAGPGRGHSGRKAESSQAQRGRGENDGWRTLATACEHGRKDSTERARKTAADKPTCARPVVVKDGRLRVIGLTGGIACGKSTVSRMLRELGAAVVDADELARQVVEPGAPALAEIVARFGTEILDGEGRLDRKKLGAIVFADPEARGALERITHPRISQASQAAIAAHAAQGADPVIYDAALIVERGLYRWMNGLIVVTVSPDVQMQRLIARDQCTAGEAAARIAAQLPLADKVAVADYIIDNSGSLDETRAQVVALWERVTRQEP